MKKHALKLVALALTLCMSVVFFACNKKDEKKPLSDYYINSKSVTEFSSARLESTLPLGWKVLTGAKNADSGYISEINGFVVTNGVAVSIVKVGSDELLIPTQTALKSLRIKDGIILALTHDDALTAFDFNGNTILSRFDANGNYRFKNTNSKNIDDVAKILDSGLIAVSSAYDKSGVNRYTSIYRASKARSAYGELVVRVKNYTNDLDLVNGFDNQYVSVTNSIESGKDVSRIVSVPSTVDGSVKNLDGSVNGTFREGTETNYFSETTYIGNGKFLVHEDWTGDKSGEYTYTHGDDCMMVERCIYTPSNDKRVDYESNYIFLNLSNSHYGIEKAGINTASFLKGDLMYASYGLFIDEDKVAYYDQYILDKDLNVVLSLSGSLGTKISVEDSGSVDVFDLIMDFVDGYGYTPVNSSSMKVYNSDGTLKFNNKENVIESAGMNNGIIVAGIRNPENSSDQLYGAFDLSGTKVVDFDYDYLENFRGYYTIGKLEEPLEDNTKYVVVGKDGVIVTEDRDGNKPLYDIAKTSSGGTFIFKMGCYMYETKVDVGGGKTEPRFGIKKIGISGDSDVLIEANMKAGATLYSPNSSPQDVFVFEKIVRQGGSASNANDVSYKIFRLV